MTRILQLLTIVVVASLTLSTVAAQKGYDLFQQALAKERAEGKPQEAIAIYQQVVKEAGTDRALAARALIQMAGCYEKVGSSEARRTYLRVVTDFADQLQQVTIAKTKLAAAEGAANAPAPNREPAVRAITLPPTGVVSPDGTKVAYIERRILYVRPLEGGTPTTLLEPPTGDHVGDPFVWSRDSRRLAVNLCGNATPASPSNKCDQRVIEADASASRTILPRRTEGIDPIDWSPDDRKILAVFFGSPTQEQAQLVLIGAADGSVRPILTAPYAMLNVPYTKPAFSADGQFIAYTSQGDVVIVPTDGSGNVRRIEHPADDRFVAWTPTKSAIFFLSNRFGTNDLLRMDIAAGQPDGLPRVVKKDVGTANPINMIGSEPIVSNSV